MSRIKGAKTHRGRRELEKRAPKLVVNEKKMLFVNGTKTSSVVNSVLSEVYHLKKHNAVKYSRKNEKIRPFEAGGETNLEFFSQKTDCALFAVNREPPIYDGRGRFYDHHIYDLVEVGVENHRSLQSFSYDKKIATKLGSKPLIAFIGEGFESVDELKHLKEVLLELLRGEVIENLNLAGVYRMRYRLPNESLRKEAMKTAPERTKKQAWRYVSSERAQGSKEGASRSQEEQRLRNTSFEEAERRRFYDIFLPRYRHAFAILTCINNYPCSNRITFEPKLFQIQRHVV